ncbi:hypothetical protein L226DRAFT_568353 [Lentinus tigrinus ALCF2SS1-7]|uniref:uncharacterized protein n=1 Tax=Lentinus tigrinus ALCF2SS1-7 TaxID=1328758 RepID=UPI0011662F48|nr:hypothetical protein L226DRAFT_568353 [Lentinus tigrinus ALCF2SS1-7]
MAHEAEPVRAPFSYSNYDVTFRSSDKVLFHLHKMVLSKASSFFEGMFTLPPNPDSPGEPQIVDMTEDANTIDHLLRMCFPKYEMLHFAPARILALHPRFLEPTSAGMPPEYADIPASAIWALVEYRKRCIEVAREAVDDSDATQWMATECPGREPVWISRKGRVMSVTGSWAWVACTDPVHPARHVQVGGRANSLLYVRDWWTVYNAAAKKELRSLPRGEVVRRWAVLQPAVEDAVTCRQCSPKAWKDLLEYSQLLAKRIDSLTSLVEIKLPF